MKIIKKILTALFIVIMVLGLYYVFALIKIRKYTHVDIMPKNEIEELYKQHETIFNNVAKKLYQYPDGLYIEEKETGLGHRTDWQYYYEEGLALATTMGDILNAEQINQLNNIPLSELFKDTKIRLITKEKGKIYFCQATSISFSTGLAYCPAENSKAPDKDDYITEWDKIAPDWYYYTNE